MWAHNTSIVFEEQCAHLDTCLQPFAEVRAFDAMFLGTRLSPWVEVSLIL
jgi:hypothetical protein